ncbi:amino acid adenylation domain-containing protein [Thermopolyspora sp. NPDC052614]|uniref:amino acid adenylation domain-containing protein n=1 Tax=Thermopolyspora sp. NPDC052614 TaxID=3155682 RepID=UPI003423BA6A
MTDTTGMPETVGDAFALIAAQDRALLPPGIIDAYPLTPRQYTRLWWGDGPAAAVVAGYRVPSGTSFTPDALDAVIHRHEVLRTSIDLDGYGEPLLLVHARASRAVSWHDHTGIAADEGERRLARIVAAERATRIDPADPPLLRVNVVAEPDGGQVLLLSASPLLCDLVDLDLLAAELLPPEPPRPSDRARGPAVIRHSACAAAELATLSDEADWDHWATVTGTRVPFTLPSAYRGDSGQAEHTVEFSDLRAGLDALAAQAGAEPWIALLAAHVAVLGMLTREPAVHTDLVLGPDCGEELHRRTLPLPVGRARTWRELVARVRQDERDCRAHRHIPGDEPVRDATHAIFEVDGRARPAPAIVRTDEPHGLRVIAGAERLRLRVRGESVAAPHAARIAAMYRAVLEAMAADPDGDARAACLPPGEWRDVLTTWAVGPTVARGDACVPELFEAQAKAMPDATAVRAPDGDLTYRELDERANRIARHLAALGAGPDVFVGVRLGRTADLLPTVLGVWKCGAVYLPLDPELPEARRRHMISAAGYTLVVDAEFLRRDRAAIEARPASPLGLRTDPARLAYVIYTSGSTGKPKGVLVEHRGLVNYLLWTCEAYAGQGTGGAPVFSSISFDLGIPNLLTPLLTGQAVHLLPDGLDPADLGNALAAGTPYAFVKMTPGHLDLLSYALTAEQAHGLAGIVIAAGDSFSTDLAARWIRLAGPGGTRVATEYGPTEITIGNSGQQVAEPPETDLVPLGQPIPNTTMRVLDERLRPVPVGVPGEICIGGVGVARGYLGHPDLTADRFVPDPYGPPGSRLYRSGDLGRWLPGGVLDFLGRIDGQMKIRGYRVEPGEIQAAVREHPDVRDCVVAARQSGLVAYVVLVPGRRLDAAALREHLAEHLPDHMIPSAFVAIDRIPLTANGKVDSRALPSLL